MAKTKKELEDQQALELWLISHSSNNDTVDTPEDLEEFNKKKLIKSKDDLKDLEPGDDIFVNI